jgi:CDP-glucose 4,6-dehydratase
VSKSCTDLICGMFATTYALPVAIVRCANLFGGGDLNFSRTVPGIIRSTLNHERFVIRSDGKFVRDFLYVKDAVEGYLALSERLAQDPGLVGQAFNFSMETQVTVLALVEMVIKLMAGSLEPIILNQASAEIRAQYMSCEKARTVLGWAPSYTLESGLIETINWYSEWLGAYAPEGVATAIA